MKTNFLLCIAFRAMLLMGSQILASHALCAQSGATYERGETRLENVFPPSPESASRVQYEDIPISLSTGMAEYSIPVGTLQGRELSVPIALTYRSGGIKVDDVSGVAGLGWNLNAGGCITREVHYMPDEFDSHLFYSQPTGSLLEDLENEVSSNETRAWLLGTLWNQRDTDADLYNYCVDGLSGRFLIAPSGDIVQLAGDGVLISFDSGTNGFKMTGPDGRIYVFGARETGARYNPTENPTPMSGQQASWTATTAWYLTEMISASGLEVAHFTYSSGGNWDCSERSSTQSWLRRDGQDIYGSLPPTTVSSEWKSVESRHSTLVLSTISLSGQQAIFNYATVNSQSSFTDDRGYGANNYPRRLTRITFNDSLSGQLARWDIDTDEGSDGRIILQGADVRGSDNTLIDRWTFSYYSRGSGNRYAQDWFGYYNGESGRHRLCPYIVSSLTFSPTLYGYPDAAVSDHMMLREVNHDGARTEWTYEGNAVPVSNISGIDSVSVGVRVKRIALSDGLTPVRMSEFSYDDPTTTFPIVPGLEDYTSLYGTVHENVHPDSLNNIITGTYIDWHFTLHDYPVTEGVSIRSAEVFYGRVTEDTYAPGESSESGTRTVYYFDADQAHFRWSENTFERFPSYWLDEYTNSSCGDLTSYVDQGYIDQSHGDAGLLLRKETYRLTSSGHQLVRREENTYQHGTGQPVLSSYRVSQVMYRPNAAGGDVQYSDLYHHPVWTRTMPGSYIDRTYTIDYFDSGNDTTVISYNWTFRDNALALPRRLSRTEIASSDGSRSVSFLYAGSNPGANAAADSLAAHHILSIPITRTFRNTLTEVVPSEMGGVNSVVLVERNRIVDSTAYEAFCCIGPNNTPVTAYLPAERIEMRDGVESWSEVILSRDSYGNVTSVKERGKPITTILWDDDGRYPLAVIENATHSQVLSTLGSGNTADDLRTALADAHVTTLTFAPGVGVTSITDPSGIKTNYNYDCALRLEAVSDNYGDTLSRYVYNLLNPGTNRLNVKRRSYRDAEGTQYSEDVRWWNTLGLKTQEISIGGAGDGRDLVCAYEGDFMLHDDVRSWLPYPKQATGGAFQISAADSSAVFHDNPKAYVAKGYEMSTRDRVQSTALPGYDGEHMGSFHEQSPGSIPLLQWDDTTGSVVNRGTWPMDEVVAEVSKDADGRGRAVVKDLFGRTLQTSAAMRPSGPAIHGVDSLGSPTRYIYDNHDRLRAVAGADIALTDTLNMWRYSYDTLGRLASKGIPGSIREHYTYDEEDRIVRIRRGTEVTGMEYDAFGRLTRKYYAPSAAGDSVLVEEHVYDTRPPVADTLLAPDPNQSFPFGWWGPVKGFETWCRLAETDGTGQVTGYTDRAFRYDSRGRLVQEVTRWPDGNRTEHSYLYDFCNNPLSDTWSVTVGDTTYTQSTDVQYDLRERPVRMEMSFYKGNMLVARDTTLYTYDALGRLAGATSSSGGYGVSQTDEYTLQGWLKQRTASRGGQPLFIETLSYDSDTPPGFSSYYTGKIAGKKEQWHLPGSSPGLPGFTLNDRYYLEGYAYDYSGRLVRTGNWRSTGILLPLPHNVMGDRFTYDARGNILTVRGYLNHTQALNWKQYSYSGDRLISGEDPSAPYGSSRESYNYDELGRMTLDGLDCLRIGYNRMDLPSQIRALNNSVLVNYSYLADGMKTSALNSQGEGLVYRDGMVFRRDTDGTLRFESAPLATGRMTADGIQYHITDHLGSVRAVIDGATGNVLEASDYSAFGDRTDVTSIVQSGLGQVVPGGSSDVSLRHHFSGKEDQVTDFSVPLSDFGARHYAPHLSRWMVPDPMSEKYYDISPYVYCANDPVNYVDPKGDDIWEIDEIGNVVNRTKDKTMDAVYLVQQLNNGEFVRRQDSSGNDLGVVFEYGTIEHQWSRTYDGGVDDIFVVRGDNNGTKLFEFLADNITFSSGIEFSLSETGLKGDEGLNYISTSHTINSEKSFRRLFYSQLYNGYTIRRHTHSHPNHSTASDDDKNARDSYNKKLTKKGLKKIDFNIYFVGNEKKGRKHIYTKY